MQQPTAEPCVSPVKQMPALGSKSAPEHVKVAPFFVPECPQIASASISQKNVRNPNHNYFSKKYRDTPPMCIAIRLQFVLQCFRCPYALRKGKYCQYSSHLYRSTPPICIAIRLPFVSQYFGENLGGCGDRDENTICFKMVTDRHLFLQLISRLPLPTLIVQAGNYSAETKG